MATPPFLPDETKPADGDVVSQFPAVERTFRDVIETWILVDHDTAGEHEKITLPELGADPSNVTDTGFLYTKDDSTDTELYYEDAAGNVIQLTEDGAIKDAQGYVGVLSAPSTTSMLFYQDAAPAGWTKDTTTLDNHALRVVSSTAWSTGSKGNTAFDSVFGSGKNAGATTLTWEQSGLRAHKHNIVIGNATGTGKIEQLTGSTANNINTDNVAAQDASQSHNHSLSLDINYINVIRCTKDA